MRKHFPMLAKRAEDRISRRARLIVVLSFCFGICGLSFGQTSSRAREITSLLQARQFDQALQLLHSELQEDPKNAQLWALQGIAFSGKADKKEALQSFRRALGLSPNYLPALEGAAEIEYETGGKDAVALLQRVLKLVPADPTAHAMLGSLAYKNHNCSEAVSHFQQAGSQLESQPTALRAYGICLSRSTHPDQAIAVFQKLVALSGDDDRDRVRLAALQLSVDKPSDASQTLEPVLQHQPDSAALSLAAEASEQQKDTPQAVKLLHQAIVQDPKNIDLYLQFADLSLVHQSFQVGVDMMNAGLKLQPNAAPLYLARGILYVQLADYEHAEADFETADKIAPQSSISEAARGMVAEQQDDLDKALSVVRTQLSKKPNDPFLLYVEADILVQKNPDVDSPDFNQAVASARRAVELQPGLVKARDTLAKLYLQADKNQLAVEQSREALKHDPNDQVAVYHLIVGLRRTGHSEELPALLQQLAQLRQKATREEGEHNRYKLIEQTESNAPPKN
jgi:tetratricopeptide (TPR) repeat protein